MNKIIEKELKKTLVADLSHFDPKTNTYTIPQYKQTKLDIGKCYIVELDQYLLDHNQSRMLAMNFNNNSYPTNRYMKIEVCKTMGKIIYIDGIGYDFENKKDISENIWSGWLLLDHLTIIETIV